VAPELLGLLSDALEAAGAAEAAVDSAGAGETAVDSAGAGETAAGAAEAATGAAPGDACALVVDDEDELPWLQAAKAATVRTATIDEKLRMRELL